MNSTESSVNSTSPYGGNKPDAPPLTVENARVMRLLIHMYEAGWNDAIDATIRAKHDTVNPMIKIRKMLLEFQETAETAVTEPDVKKSSSGSVPRLR